ncbi:Biotin--protein ligase [Fulvia fulva]|nr:Biotin--protein ligase [Fulvia fulva]WPV17496.1 Biotin--protein ligase [Fulvia fulva]
MSSQKRVNVLIYAGAGASLSSVRHATWSLRRLLGPHYSIQAISADQILKEPWPNTCALLVFPGGADTGYCRTLDGAGNRRIKQYVRMGGKYLGLCAGGYYGSSKCEFEVGKKGMEVVGDRDLAFFPGTCRGLAFPGFVYQSEAGARAVELSISETAFPHTVLDDFISYYNGGGVFVDAEKYAEQGVEVLAQYHEELNVEGGEAKAAVVYCKVGEGAAILTGPHPEFAGNNLNRTEESNPNYASLVDTLLADDEKRTEFMKASLKRLGLEVSEDTLAVPSLSRLHLSAAQPGQIEELLQSWQKAGLVSSEHDGDFIGGEQDTFKVEKDDSWNMANMKDALPSPVKKAADVLMDAVSTPSKAKPRPSATTQESDRAQADPSPDRPLDYDALTKGMTLHVKSLPDLKATPHFSHHQFFHHLKTIQAKQPGISGDFGRILMYGEVVTSTQTLLEKNTTLLSHLPIGTTCTATTQISGRGRGTNVWVSPPGTLVFSTVMKHSMSNKAAQVVFVQYIAALAIVAGIQNYGSGYEKLPIRLKWPNDIYALKPTSDPSREEYVKIGGILVNSSYSGGDYTLIVGIGLNLDNAAPTTSINQLAAKQSLEPLTPEPLLASILTQFEMLFAKFCVNGFDQRFESQYYESWLHTDQLVTLEMEGNVKARIKGITSDYGLLVAEEEGGAGKRFMLQSDGNSFDFFRGLVRVKG